MTNTLTFKFNIPDYLLDEGTTVNPEWGKITGDITDQQDLVDYIDEKLESVSTEGLDEAIDNVNTALNANVQAINVNIASLGQRVDSKLNSADFETYKQTVYTKQEVNGAIADAISAIEPEEVDLSEYATNTSVNTNYAKKEHNHDERYVKKTDDYVKSTDLDVYAKKEVTDSSISDISTRLNTLKEGFETLVGDGAAVNETIDNFNEVKQFLNGISDSDSLVDLMYKEHKALSDKIDTKLDTETAASTYAPKILTPEIELNDNDDTTTLGEYIDAKVKKVEMFKFPNATIYGQPTINNGQISNFSADNYMQFPFLVNFQNKPFVISMCFTTGNNVTEQENIFDSEFGLAFAIKNGHFICAYGTNGTSWENQLSCSTVVEPNTTYYVKLQYTGSQFLIQTSTDGTTYVDDSSLDITNAPHTAQIIIGKDLTSRYIFGGIINLNYCDLTISEKVVWQGMDDVGLATRLATDMSNLDEAGVNKIKEIASEAGSGYTTEEVDKMFADSSTYVNNNYVKSTINEFISKKPQIKVSGNTNYGTNKPTTAALNLFGGTRGYDNVYDDCFFRYNEPFNSIYAAVNATSSDTYKPHIVITYKEGYDTKSNSVYHSGLTISVLRRPDETNGNILYSKVSFTEYGLVYRAPGKYNDVPFLHTDNYKDYVYTKKEIDTKLGDINTILESI